MMEIITINFNGIIRNIFVKHINLFNMCGAYASAKYFKNQGFSIDYALACLSQSKFNRSI